MGREVAKPPSAVDALYVAEIEASPQFRQRGGLHEVAETADELFRQRWRADRARATKGCRNILKILKFIRILKSVDGLKAIHD